MSIKNLLVKTLLLNLALLALPTFANPTLEERVTALEARLNALTTPAPCMTASNGATIANTTNTLTFDTKAKAWVPDGTGPWNVSFEFQVLKLFTDANKTDVAVIRSSTCKIYYVRQDEVVLF